MLMNSSYGSAAISLEDLIKQHNGDGTYVHRDAVRLAHCDRLYMGRYEVALYRGGLPREVGGHKYSL